MKTITTGFFIFSFLLAGVVYSHTDATGIVRERMDAMLDMGDKSKLVADMFKGKSEFERNAVADVADAFVSHGVRMAELFPDTQESRNGSHTEALPRIWEEWDKFNEQVTEFVELSESLKNTVSTTDDINQLRKAFFKTTKGCSGCHKLFRKPKD